MRPVNPGVYHTRLGIIFGVVMGATLVISAILAAPAIRETVRSMPRLASPGLTREYVQQVAHEHAQEAFMDMRQLQRDRNYEFATRFERIDRLAGIKSDQEPEDTTFEVEGAEALEEP